MEDHEIVALYWQRNEQAITESDGKYGALCRHVSRKLAGQMYRLRLLLKETLEKEGITL